MTRATTIVIILIVLLTGVLLVHAAGAQTAFLPQVYNGVEPSPTPEAGYTWTWIFHADVQGSKLGIWGAKPGYCYNVVVDRGATVNIESEKNTNCNRDDYNPDAPWPPPEFPPPEGMPEFGQYELFTIVMNKGPQRVCGMVNGVLNCVEVTR